MADKDGTELGDSRVAVDKAALSPFRLPTDTAPTWEVELLLSGATLFALMQLPTWLGSQLMYWETRVTGSLGVAIGMGGLFAKIIAYTLISTLLFHLMTRALWVAAIGLRSVYPVGVRWRKLRYGPRFRAVARRDLPTLKRLIERSDDIASQMFAIAALMVVLTLFSVLVMALFSGVAWALSQVFGGRHFAPIMLGLVFVWVSLHLLAVWIDRRVRPRSRFDRWLGWVPVVQRLQLLLPMGKLSTGLMLVFTSRLGAVKGTLLLLFVLYALMGVSIFDQFWSRKHLWAGHARFIPSLDGSHLVEPAHYADQRDPLADALVPYVHSMTPQESWLRLRIPFNAVLHPAAFEAGCPGAHGALEAAAAENAEAHRKLEEQPESIARMRAADLAESEAAQALLACVAKLHDLRLDGSALAIEFSFHAGDRQHMPGFLAMIPIDALAPGRHVLEVARLPAPGRDVVFAARKPRPAAGPRQIVFWK